jgi:hypothetical protein
VVIEPTPEQLSKDNRPASTQFQLGNQIEEVTPRKKPQPFVEGAYKLVAWDGIEPSTRGFSILK